MNVESLELLEYERLRALVARYVASEAGRRLLAGIEPRHDRQTLLTELSEAAEAITYLKDAAKPQTRGGEAPARLRFEGLPDVDEACARLRIAAVRCTTKNIVHPLANVVKLGARPRDRCDRRDRATGAHSAPRSHPQRGCREAVEPWRAG